MHDPKPLLSRPVLVATLSDDDLPVTVTTTAAERAALAQADSLVDLPALEGRFTLKRERAGQGVRVVGAVVARVVQTCTVSLDPFESDIREEVDLLFVPQAQVVEAARRQDDDAEAEDPPDAIVDGRIDLGVVTAEFLALGLDPYPRKPGVEFDAASFAGDADPSPFAALAALKKAP